MKKIVLLILLTLGLCSCEINNDTSDVVSSQPNSDSDVSYSSTDIVDYSSFDENLIGKWYVNSNNMDVLPINTEFEIFDDYTLKIQDINFDFVGLYEEYEGACQFISESKNTTFIASFDEGVINWGLIDINGTSDIGVAGKEPIEIGFKYDYVGPDWPMEKINEWLELEGNIPSYPSSEYSLLNSISQIYDEKYAMIDIFDAPDNSSQEYINMLEEEGYNFSQQKDGFGFYVGHDAEKKYSLRIQYFGEGNLTVFIYNYDVLF